MIGSIFSITGLVNAITSFTLGFFVLRRNPRSSTIVRFALFCFSVTYWSLFYFLWQISETEDHALVFVRHLMIGAAFIPAFFTMFVHRFLDLRRPRLEWLNGIFSVTSALFSQTPYFVSGVEPRMIFYYWPVPGPVFHVVLGIFTLNTVYAHALLWRAMRRSRGVKRSQIQYVFIGTLIGFIGGSTNFFLWYDIPIPPVLNILVSLYIVTVTYGILKYKLMDINVLIKKTLVFAGLFTMVFMVLVAITTLTQNWLGQYLKISPLVSTVLGVLAAMSLYDPARRFLVNVTDRFLFQKQFKLSTIVAQASYAIAFVQSLKWLSRRIVAFLVTKCRIKHAVVYIRSEQSGNFIRGALRGYGRQDLPPRVLYESHMVIRYLYESRGPIEIRRLEELIEKNPNSLARTGLFVVLEFLKSCQAEVLIPSFLRRRIDASGQGKELRPQEPKDEEIVLRNILILGGKKSDEPYQDEDLDVFYSLAQESAIAIENARLYDEAVQKTRLLAEMNRELAETNEKLQVTQASLIVAEKNATMVGMAQAIGHEVNNPLTIVLMRTDIVYRDKIRKCKELLEQHKDRFPEEPYQKLAKLMNGIEDDIARASRSAHRINAVVHTLTDILRDTKGEMGALSLRVLFHEAIEATRFSTYEENLAGCDIKLEVASNVMVRGNLEQLLQVFVNLIKNAYEAMEHNKDRCIQIRGDVDPENPKMAKITVADNGPGIPPELLPRIWGQGFTTKQRKDNSIGAAGQGQGLFVCKHMIESVHRGSIICESQPGQGTTFIVRLPLAEMEVIQNA